MYADAYEAHGKSLRENQPVVVLAP